LYNWHEQSESWFLIFQFLSELQILQFFRAKMSKDNGKENFMYLPPPLEMRQNLMQDETASEKFARKIKEHPLVPIGNHLILN